MSLTSCNSSYVLSFADVAVPSETKQSAESTLSVSESRTVGNSSASVVDKFSLMSASDPTNPSQLTAEEILKHASENVALKQLSESLVVMGSAEAVACSEIPDRDNEIDGAEDNQEVAYERSQSVVAPAAKLTTTDCSVASDSSSALPTQKTVAVAALPSGVYITKPSQPSDSQATATQDVDCDGGRPKHEHHRMQLQKQFPILLDLSQRPQQKL